MRCLRGMAPLRTVEARTLPALVPGVYSGVVGRARQRAIPLPPLAAQSRQEAMEGHGEDFEADQRGLDTVNEGEEDGSENADPAM